MGSPSEICVYCAAAEGTTRDHVLARGFFPLDKRAGIPVVPACATCNNLKAALEHYATAVVPFGATHTGSGEVLSKLVPARLANNLKLARSLADGKGYSFVSNNYGATWDTAMSLPLEGETINALFHMIARGLAYAEYGVLLPDAECVVHAGFLVGPGRRAFDALHAQRGDRTGTKNLGGGIFVYDGVQSWESPQLTVWRMSLCGISVSNHQQAPGERVEGVHAITAPRRMAAAGRLVEFLRAQAAAA